MNLRTFLNITNRITVGYIMVIVVVLTTSITGIIILQQNNKISGKDLPLISGIREFDYMVIESKRLSNNWIYIPNVEEKEKLKEIHVALYPKLKTRVLNVLSNTDEKTDESKKIKTLFKKFEEILSIQQLIMEELISETDYANDEKVDKAIELFIKKLDPQTKAFSETLSVFLQEKNTELQTLLEKQKNANWFLSIILQVMSFFIIVLAIIIHVFARKTIAQPLNQLKKTIDGLGKGEIVKTAHLKKRNSLMDGYNTDEIGQMTDAIDVLVLGIKHKTEFAKEIGKGNFDKEFALLSEKDSMGAALMEMRDKLKKNKEEDEKRNWTITGLAGFVDLLRENHTELKELGNKIISKLVKYTDSNQGALFIINDDKPDDIFIEQLSCYAWERKKYIRKKIALGEGLIGQAVKEGEYIYMTDIPDNYVNILSGLGDANPNSILIMPVKIEEEVFGVIELASFKTFEKHTIEFVQKIGENIAASIKSTKNNLKTQKLLHESQQQSEEMRAQEEEMRQNLEELAATQEEMQRKEKNYLLRFEDMKNQIEKLQEIK